MFVGILNPQKIVLELVDVMEHEYDAENCRLELYNITDVCIGSRITTIWDATRAKVNIDTRLYDTIGIHI